MAIDVSSSEWVRNSQKKSYNNVNDAMNTNIEENSRLFSFDAERALLGGILLEPKQFESIAPLLKPEDFYDNSNKIVYTTMLELSRQNEPIDIIALQENIPSIDVQGIVTPQYLLNLQHFVPATLNLRTYASTILDKSRTRRLVNACRSILDDALNSNDMDIEELLDSAESKILKINDEVSKTESGPRSMTEVVLSLVEELDKRRQNPQSGLSGISTGYVDLDNYLSGFHGGELIIVAARPAMGKTTFAMNLVENIAMNENNHKPVLVFSLEMPANQIAARLVASMGRIDQGRIRNFNLDAQDWGKLVGVINKLSEKRYSIFIDDTSGLTPTELRSRARRIAKDYGGLSAIMVDYLQLMHAPGFKDARNLEVGEISRSLKALAKELNIPVIALAQLNRGLEGRKEKRPMNADLRESGSIEQDADVIMFVHREEVYNQNDASLKGKAEIIIGKQRNGPIGTVNLVFLNQYSRFENCMMQNNAQ